MAITLEEVKKLANLARIKLTPEEEKRHTETISAVLDYMKLLNEVDTANIPPTDQIAGLEDVVRPDEPKKSSYRNELIKMMPEIEGEELVVPRVFED